MTLPFELYVATRYLLAKRRQAFISVISAVSALGVTVGVMALIIALALMTGMQQEIRDRIVGAAAHVYVQKLLGGGFVDREAELARLAAVPGVVAAAPATLGYGMATAHGVDAFVTLKGVDPVLEAQVTEVAESMVLGSFAALSEPREGVLGGVGHRRRPVALAPGVGRRHRFRAHGAGGDAVAHGGRCRGGGASRWSASSASGCGSTTARTASSPSTRPAACSTRTGST